MKKLELIIRESLRLTICALAVASACGSQAQTVRQILFTDDSGDVRLQKGPVITDADLEPGSLLVPGSLGLGESNSALEVTVRSPGVRINGNLTLGNVVTNSTTAFKVNESRNTVTGLLSTEGQRLEFTLSPNATPVSPPGAQNLNVRDGTGSGRITTHSLFMGGTETFGITLNGSLKDAAKYRLIESDTAINVNNQSTTRLDFNDVTSQGVANCQVCRVTDNSFVITSRVYVESESDGTWRYVTYEASRSSDVYITKSNSFGHFSNNAAYTLGNIAKNGYQLGDLTTAITMIDLDSHGYGDTMEHLAVQAKRLAPIANNSYIRSAFTVSDLLGNVLDDRLISLRRDGPGRSKDDGPRFWLQPFGNKAKQSGVDDYDGYRVTTSGFSMGYDHALDDSWVGASLSVANSRLDQLNFRAGDTSSVNGLMFRLYAVREIGAMYIDGAVGMGRHDYSGSRQTAIDRVARDSFTLSDLNAKFGIGYRIKLKDPRSVFVPYMQVTISEISQPEYTETGAGDLGLNYDAKNFRRIRSVLGLRYNTESRMGDSHSFTTMHVAWGRDKIFDNLNIQSRYSGLTPAEHTSFMTPVSEFDRSLVMLGLSSTIALSKTASLRLGTELEHRRGYYNAGVQARATWAF
jgi:outer membrane autotransporter protein